MADPPDCRTSYAIGPGTAAPPQPDATAVGTEGANTADMGITATQVNAAPALNTNSAAIGNDSATPDGDAIASTSVLIPNVATQQCSTATLTSQQPGTASEEHTAECADNNPSLFAKLPGELRNRIYRAYFEDFREQKKKTLNIKKTAPTYLKLLHTD